MFRFSVDRATAERVNAKQLASNGVGRDDDWEEGLPCGSGLETNFTKSTATLPSAFKNSRRSAICL